MVKKYFIQAVLFFLALLAAPLHAMYDDGSLFGQVYLLANEDTPRSEEARKALEEKKVYLEKLLAMNKKRYGATHAKVAITMVKLASVLNALGEYAAAKTYYQKARKIEQQHSQPSYFSRMVDLAAVIVILVVYTLVYRYYNNGKYASAKKCLEKALHKTEAHHGDNDPNSAMAMHLLGNVLNDLGDYALAKDYYEKALKIKKQCFGEDHPNTAVTMHNLGNVLVMQGEYGSAQEYLVQTLNIKERYYGGDDRDTANTIENLGVLFAKLEDYASAEKYLKKALVIHKQAYGDDHHYTAMTMEHLGDLFSQQGQKEKARQYYQKTIKVYTSYYGATYARTAKVKEKLALLDNQQN